MDAVENYVDRFHMEVGELKRAAEQVDERLGKAQDYL